jgi:protein-tyrosine phosphatase
MVKGSGEDRRTSESHPIKVDWLPRELIEGVGLTFAPGKKGRSINGYTWDRDLGMDLDRLVDEYRANVLVTLMEVPELEEVGIPNLITEATTRGLTTVHFPIRDVHAPRAPADVEPLLDTIEGHLADGKRVVIHCLGGIGRTGTIATTLLVRRGVPLERAIRTVREVRCSSFPEGAEQGPFVEAYAKHVAAQAATRSVPPGKGNVTSGGVPWALLEATAPPASLKSPRQVSELLAALEGKIAASPARCFTADGNGAVTLRVKDQTFHAGRFETPTIAELKRRLQTRPHQRGHLRLSALRGTSTYGDIGYLQASAPPETLFQAASQFNCLEAPGARLVPVHDYPFDATQGPRASVSAFPGTFLRHYFAPRPDGTRFVQTDKDAINLLADALPPAVGRVRSGYLTSSELSDPTAAARALEDHFEQIRVGLHDNIEVALGADWGGSVENAPHQRVAQAFTSTIALGGYSRDDGSKALATVRQQLLRGAYLGTILGAIALGKRRVVLTMIGGGAFGNPHRAIWDAIHWSLDAADSLADGIVDVVVNIREADVLKEDHAQIRERGGTIIEHTTHELRSHR